MSHKYLYSMYYIMENIKTFEEYLNEGFDADVKTTEKDNTLKIQLPDEDSTRTFRLDKDSQPEEVLDNDKISSIDKSNPLNKFVKGAINGIRNIKEQDRANEIERVSGNYPELIDDVRRAYDNGIIRINKPDSDKVYSLWDKIKEIEVGTVDKEKNYISFKDVTKSQDEWFTKTAHQVGKGEFYLPILFPDVYKNTKEEIGDNKLKINDDNKLKINDKDKYIDLEIKTSGAHFKFDENGKLSKNEIDFVKKNKYDDSTKTKFKTLISKTLINYLLNRNTNYNEIDLILFDNQNTPNPDGIFVLRLNKSDKDNSNKVNKLANELKNVIEIDDSFGKSDDFDIRYDNTKKSIIVRLSSSKYNSNHKFKERFSDDEVNSMIQDFINGKSDQIFSNKSKRKHIAENSPEFKLKVISIAIDNGWSRAEIANMNGLKTFEKYMTENTENLGKVFTYIKSKEDEDPDIIIKFIWGKNSDYIKSKGIEPKNIDDDMLKAFIQGEGSKIDELIKLMIDNNVDFSKLIFGEKEAKNIKDTLLKAENNNIEANNLIVKRNPPRCKRTVKKELTEEDVIKIINGYCSDNLDIQVEGTQAEDIQAEDIQAKGKQGKKFFISWLTRNLQKIKNEGLLWNTSLQNKLKNSEEFLEKEKNNYKEFLNKKESYHIQTFDEMFND